MTHPTATTQPGTVCNRLGRAITGAMPADYPLTARCAVCHSMIVCADSSADWVHRNNHLQRCPATISTENVMAHDLPAHVTAVLWTDPHWVECIDHLYDPHWAASVERSAEATGVALTGVHPCDSCEQYAAEQATRA